MILPSPIVEIQEALFREKNIRLFVKREDLIDPHISGNKWRKLKGTLDKKPKGIITFGGAFSNHIYSTAAAGHYYKIPTIGIIRGEIDEDNPTIQACRKWNMELISVSRTEYRLKNTGQTYLGLKNAHPDYFYVPEGGSNDLANIGLGELAEEISESYDYIALAAGTGGTARGLIKAMPEQKFLIISSLKGNDLHKEFGLPQDPKINILSEYHHGGYGKTSSELINFINSFKTRHNIPLDPIYNGKVVYGLYDLIRRNKISDCSILWIHTGGLQGINGYNYLAEKKSKGRIVK